MFRTSGFVLFTLVLLALSVHAQTDAIKLEQVRAHYEKAQKFEQQAEWANAEEAWRAALELSPEDARAWTNLGVVLNRQQKEEEALSAWNHAITLDPKLAGPYFNIGLLLVRRRDYSGAVSHLRRALSIEPNNEGARRGLALALVGVENFPEATREIAKLLAKNPRDADLLELASRTFLKQRRYAEAVTVLQRRLQLPGPTSLLWAEYGDALDGAKRTTEAVEAYRTAVKLDPDSTLVRYGLGYLYWKIYQFDDAERELAEVLGRDPKDARAAFTMGDLYLTKGDVQKALPFLRIAAVGYPNEFDTRFALGRALILTGDLRAGVEELRAAVSIDSAIADGHFQLGRAFLKLGLKEEGNIELAKAKELQTTQRNKEAEGLRKKLP